MMIFPEDSVAMVLEDAQKGDVIETPRGRVELLEDVEFAHKVAVVPLKKGDPVIKYREEIGYMLRLFQEFTVVCITVAHGKAVSEGATDHKADIVTATVVLNLLQ